MTRLICRSPRIDEIGISVQEFEVLSQAFLESDHWIRPPDEVKQFFKTFKSAVKSHFFFHQGRRCCYCCIELTLDHATFTLDHVIARSIGVQFILAVANMGVSCKPCNTKKTDQPALVSSIDVSVLTEVPIESADYILVHPQLDDWDENFKFDGLRRISAKTAKGRWTFAACGIERINALRVADNFREDLRSSVYNAALKIMKYKQRAKRKAMADVLREAAAISDSAIAKSLADQIIAEFE